MRNLALALTFALTLGTAVAPATAATTISFAGGSSGTSGAAGNVRVFTVGGLQVQASAWSYSGSTLNRAYLGWYGNGLGVTNVNEGNGGSSSHAVDNFVGRDFILLVFNQSVNLVSGVLTPYAQTTTPRDNDAAISNTNVAGLFAAGSGSLTAANPLFGTLATNQWNVSGTNSAPFGTSFASGVRSGNVWLVGAASSGDNNADGFKLTSILAAPVPEPGTWAMFLLGFGAIGAAMRRRRAGAVPAIA